MRCRYRNTIHGGTITADYDGSCCRLLEERVAQLKATTARWENHKISLTIRKWAIMQHDAEGYSVEDLKDTVISNNPNDTSKFGFRGEAQLRPGVTAGYLLEIGVGNIDDDDEDDEDLGGTGLTIRHSALYLQHEQLGRVW